MSRADLIRSEHGGVLVTVAFLLLPMILMTSFVVDVGNWFVHKRHLQLQADAGAFAPATLFNACIGNNAGADAAIKSEARKYAGDPSVSPRYNEQIGGASRGDIIVALNSKTYPDPGPNKPAPDDTIEGNACAAAMIDVKLTNSNVPWFIRATSLGSPFIRARARTEIKVATGLNNVLPVAFPDPTPKKAEIVFFDEDSPGTVLGSAPLTDSGLRTAEGYPIWDSSAAAIASLNVGTVRHIGVRIVLSGSSSTTCGDRLVSCYLDATKGLLFVRGYAASASRGASTNPPVARQITVTDGTPFCAYTNYLHTNASGCTVRVDATVSIGTVPLGDIQLAVYAPGCNANNGCTMSPGALVNGAYTFTVNVPVAAGSGVNDIRIQWRQRRNGAITGYGTCANNFGGACRGWLDGGPLASNATGVTVGRSVASNVDVNGPIRIAQIYQNNSTPLTSHSVPLNSTLSNVVVKIALEGALRIAVSASDPPAPLKLVGSQTQALDCDPNYSNLRDELALGCRPTYAVNSGEACPPGNNPAQWPTNPPAIWTCVVTQTGSSVGQVEQGLNERVHGDRNANRCVSPSNWSSYPNLPAGDPRIVFVFLTPYGTFGGSGNDAFPIVGLATFYIRGYGGNPCNADPSVPNGWITGNFIKYVAAFPPGGTTGAACDFTSTDDLMPCVAVLTR